MTSNEVTQRRACAVASVRPQGSSVTELEVAELASLGFSWEFWARPKQLPPERAWRSFGLITGRGFGKTRCNCEFVIGEVMAGRARDIIFAAQNLDETERTMMLGPSGLVQCSPPWFKPIVTKGVVVWPNGATATPMTPEVPHAPRGGNRDLAWMSEIAAWPAATREEFFSNVKMSVRSGAGRLVYDTTPRARNPLVRQLIERALRDPMRHVIVRGSSRENIDNLTDGVVAEWEAELGGTHRGREELEGEFFDDADGALFRQEWIDRARRDMPTALRRRVLSIDPTISTRKGTDRTGLVELGLGVDDQVHVIADHTDRYAAETWGALLLRLYVEGQCDCIVVERNRGGDLVAANIRASAERRGLRVEIVDGEAPVRHASGVVYVKEVISRKGKELRAEPVASLYERGRVSHTRGVDLTELEELMCLVGGTMVETDRGPVPIESVEVGDHVQTRAGLRRVRWSGQTGEASKIVTISAGRSSIQCTASHPVYVLGEGFVRADAVRVGQRVIACRTRSTRSSSSTDAGTSFSGCTATTRPAGSTVGDYCTATFGRLHTAQSRPAGTCTTSTRIAATTTCPTSRPSVPGTTSGSTDRRAPSSTTVQRGACVAALSGRSGSRATWCASSVERPTSPRVSEQNSAVVDAVDVTTHATPLPVFNLTVDGLPEFFANGILVHNCTWQPEAGGASPDALDALVHGVWELAGLSRAQRTDSGGSIAGARTMNTALATAPKKQAQNIAVLLGGGRRGDRI